MATFQFQTPNGNFEVEAPDQETAVKALQGMNQPSAADQANARAQAGIAQAQAGTPSVQIDQNTGQPPGVPAYSPRNYGQGGSAAMGAADATTMGWGDELASYLGSGLTGVPRDQVLAEMRANAGKAQSDNPGSYLAGQIGGGLAQAAATGGGGAGSALAQGGAGLGRVALGSALDGAAYGGAYGAGSADNGDRLTGGTIGAGIGGAAGLAAPILAASGSALARKVVSPFASSPEREAAVQILAQEGVPLTAGQRTGSNALRYAESEIGGSKAAKMADTQAEAFTNAAMQKAGGAGRATSDNMSKLKDQLGAQFNDLSANNTLKVDRGILADMNAANVDYMKVLPSEQKKIFGNLGDDIVQKFKDGKGVMSGEVYQTTRSRLTRMANSYKVNDPEFSNAIRGLRDALDNGMDRSIRPEDASKWALLRQRYGNLKTLEKAAVGGGEDSAMGLISPAQLRVAAASGNRGAYARGQGDFADLAKAGQAVMSKLPNSGTASRINARSLGMFAPTVIGAGYGGAQGGDIKSAMLGAAAGYGLQRGAGSALMSKLVQSYLGNQAAAGPSSKAAQAALASLMRNGGIQALLGSTRN